MILPFLQSVLGSLTTDLIIALILVIMGVIIVVLIGLFIIFLPAILLAIVVYFLTGGSVFWAGIVFLVVAAFSLLKKL